MLRRDARANPQEAQGRSGGMSPAFKVGDKVKLRRSGEIVTVVSIVPETFGFHYTIDSGNALGTIWQDDAELMTLDSSIENLAR